MMKLRYITILALFAGIISCQPEFTEDFQPSNGEVDFSTYISLGNSLTAGYADGALYHAAQAQSWPSLLAKQFQQVGGGEFIQPVVVSEQGVFEGKLELALLNGQLIPVPAEDGELEGFYPPLTYEVHNLGVPGAKVSHLLAPGYGNVENLAAGLSNPYFIRFASSPDISVIEQAIDMSPSFFSLWLGNNDVLGYASSGGAFDEITPIADFTYDYHLVAQGLSSTGAKGVLANIPNITSTPYFTTIPNNALVVDASTATQLNFGITLVESNLNNILALAELPPYSYDIVFTEGDNRFLIQDKDFPHKDLLNAIADTTSSEETKMLMHRIQFRQMTPSELLTLRTPQDSLALGMGSFMVVAESTLPIPFGIPNRYVLDEAEIALIQNTIDAYNEVIKSTAEQYDLAFVDMNTYLNELKEGVFMDGIEINAEFVRGGIFSLDGIHLTPRGNAMVTHFFIQAINAKYNSSVSSIYLSDFDGVNYP